MWIEAIVMPRENDSRPYRPSQRLDRRAVYKAGCEESLEFRATVLNFLQAHQLMVLHKSRQQRALIRDPH